MCGVEATAESLLQVYSSKCMPNIKNMHVFASWGIAQGRPISEVIIISVPFNKLRNPLADMRFRVVSQHLLCL